MFPFSSLTKPSSRSLSPSERRSRPLITVAPSSRPSPCLSCTQEPRTAHSLPPVPSHRATRRPAADPSLSHPAASPERGQSPWGRRLAAGEPREQHQEEPRPCPPASLTEPRAAPAAASRARPHRGGAAHAHSDRPAPVWALPSWPPLSTPRPARRAVPGCSVFVALFL